MRIRVGAREKLNRSERRHAKLSRGARNRALQHIQAVTNRHRKHRARQKIRVGGISRPRQASECRIIRGAQGQVLQGFLAAQKIATATLEVFFFDCRHSASLASLAVRFL